MTDYCTLDDALSRLGDLTLRDADEGVPATTPSRTQAKALLAQVTEELDMHLYASGVTLPVTGTKLAFLHAIAMNGVAARIAKAKWRTDTGPGGDNGVVREVRDDYNKGLAFIDRGGFLRGSGAGAEEAESAAYAFTRPYAVLADVLDTTDDVETF